MKPPKTLLLIFFFALLLRLYNLSTFPMGFHVDEIKVAWQSLSILKTGRDDQGTFLPLYYNSFGDYRPTGIFYLTIPSILLLGKSEIATRFPSAFLGALTVFPIYFLAERFSEKKKLIPLGAAFFLAILPWHISTSRGTSEVVVSCFLILSSFVLLKKYPLFSFIFLIASFFFYHSARVIGPLFMAIWITKSWNEIEVKIRKKIFFFFLITTFLSATLLFSPTGLARYNQVKSPFFNLRNTLIQYFSYFDPNFFIGDIAKPFRYVTSNIGIVSLPIFFLFLLGIYVLIKSNQNKILFLFFVLAPLPASLTLEDSPNLHRSFFLLPFLVITASVGLNWLWDKHQLLAKITLMGTFFSLLAFLINYFTPNNNFAFQYRNPQTKELAFFLANQTNSYNHIYITNDPDSPYPWYAFFTNISPSDINPQFQKQINGKWQYHTLIWDNTRCPAASAFDKALQDKTKILVVDQGACYTDFNRIHSEAKLLTEFIYNTKVSYRIWEYDRTQ